MAIHEATTFSPDRHWFWNGSSWQPVAAPHRRRLWITLAAIGGVVALLAILAGAGFLWLASSVDGSLARSDAGCPGCGMDAPSGFPADFPVYQRSNLEFAVRGDHGSYRLEYLSGDPQLDIADSYRSSLDQGDWQEVRAVKSNGRYYVDFQRRSDSRVRGTVEVDPPRANGVVTIWVNLTTGG